MKRRLIASALSLAALLATGPHASAAGDAWSPGAPMPTARSEIALAVLDGRIYVAGGLAQFGTTAAFQVYDPAADRWQKLTSLPERRHHAGLAALGGRVYLTGGYRDLSFSDPGRQTWAYDPAADRWHQVADMPGPRAAHAMAALGDRLYVVGGVGPDPAAVWAYDPSADRWSASAAPLPTLREHLVAVALDDRLYVIGGRWRGVGNLATVEIYDPRVDSWTRGADMPTPRGGLAAAAFGGQVHVTGGEAFDPRRTFDAHEVYDPASGRWSTAPPLPVARHGLASGAVAGKWYVIGGGEKAAALTMLSLSDRVDIFAP